MIRRIKLDQSLAGESDLIYFSDEFEMVTHHPVDEWEFLYHLRTYTSSSRELPADRTTPGWLEVIHER